MPLTMTMLAEHKTKQINLACDLLMTALKNCHFKLNSKPRFARPEMARQY
jgi:hypothetical protein